MYYSNGVRGGYKGVDLMTGADAGTYPKSGCGPGSASANCLYGGGQGFSVTDLTTRQAWTLDNVFRTPCVEGPMPANGLLFLMPSHCGCAYPVQGAAALVPAPAQWAPPAADGQLDTRLVRGPAFDAPLAEEAKDGWTHFRGGPGHTGVAAAAPRTPLKLAWERKLVDQPTLGSLEFYRAIDRGYVERNLYEQLPAPSFGVGLAYVASRQKAVWGLDQATGAVRWKFLCGGGVRVTPAYWRGRVLVGCDDGWVYCLDAKTGRLAWRFRAAPEDRYINVEGQLGSTWPVGTGVVVDNGTAYCVAGLLGYDGAYLYALDVKTGKAILAKQVGGTGSLNDGTSQGIMALAGDRVIVPRGAKGVSAYSTTSGARVALPPTLAGGEAMADGDTVLVSGPGPQQVRSWSMRRRARMTVWTMAGETTRPNTR